MVLDKFGVALTLCILDIRHNPYTVGTLLPADQLVVGTAWPLIASSNVCFLSARLV